jgi:hypothetical protein
MNIKVGDELAFDCGFGSARWRIATVTKITPSGRIKCGPYTLDHDLRVRGQDKWSGPFRGQPVTQEIRDKVERETLLGIATDARRHHNLTLDQLRRIVAILKEQP